MFKKIGLLVTAIFLIASGTGAYAYGAQMRPFTDVPNDWAAKSIYKLSILGIVSGVGDGKFQGNGVLTREAFVKMLMASVAVDKPTGDHSEIPIQDVDQTRWSYPYIQQAYEAGMIDFMIQNDRFEPAKPITREEVAVMAGRLLLAKASEKEQKDWQEAGWKSEENARGFIDRSDIKSDFKPELYYTSSLGIMVGDATGKFRPQSSLTRKEAAAMIDRIMNEQVKKHKLSGIGFYAIQSYGNADKMNLLDEVKFGWSSLKYTGDGSASLDTKTVPFAIPNGWETVKEIAERYNVSQELMIFADNQEGKLSRFLADQAAQQAFIQSVQDSAETHPYGFTGYSIDFEGLVQESDRQAYVSFLRTFRASFPDQTLSVAVPPTVWYKGYDLKEIGNIADQVILMAYDYTHMESKLPSAPLPLVHEAIQTALKEIPKEKLVLGISKQANQWITRPNGEIVLEKPAIQLVEDRANQPGSAKNFALPYFLQQITFEDDRGAHEIWYEDAESLEAKIWLARYYGLQGVSFWHMGNLTQKDWDVIRKSIAN